MVYQASKWELLEVRAQYDGMKVDMIGLFPDS